MTNFLLLILLCVLLLINDKLYQLLQKEKPVKEEKKTFKELLPSFKGKYCEISLNKYLASLDHLYNGMMNIKARIIDFDDEWIILETYKKDRKYRSIIRISLITDILEIND